MGDPLYEHFHGKRKYIIFFCLIALKMSDCEKTLFAIVTQKHRSLLVSSCKYINNMMKVKTGNRKLDMCESDLISYKQAA